MGYRAFEAEPSGWRENVAPPLPDGRSALKHLGSRLGTMEMDEKWMNDMKID